MLAFLRRRRAAAHSAALSQTSFSESRAEVCTAACRASAHYERVRSSAMTYTAGH
ncbi:MAG TPA: hypothetical protein VFX61_15110 [Micromonosporaceae bacterium]|nr:hypothetical protein [Micromonosporaceae bacterium]